MLVCPIAVHRDPAIFPNPDKFELDRSLPAAMESRHKGGYLLFGMGTRQWPGNVFSLTEVALQVATIGGALAPGPDARYRGAREGDRRPGAPEVSADAGGDRTGASRERRGFVRQRRGAAQRVMRVCGGVRTDRAARQMDSRYLCRPGAAHGDAQLDVVRQGAGRWLQRSRRRSQPGHRDFARYPRSGAAELRAAGAQRHLGRRSRIGNRRSEIGAEAEE